MAFVLGACGGGADVADRAATGPPTAGGGTAGVTSPAPTPASVTSGGAATSDAGSDEAPSSTKALYEPEPVEPVTAPPAPTFQTVPLPSPVPTLAPATCTAANGTVTMAGRRVLLRAPALTGRSPVVIVLHGYTGSPESVEASSRFTDLGARVGAIVAYPRGTKVRPRGFGWSSGAGVFATPEADDVGVLAAILDELVASHCGDPSRVLLVGESNGGGMVLRAVCDPRLNGRVTAVAPVIAAVGAPTIAACGADDLRPVPLLAVAGAVDDVVPYGGQSPLLGQEAWFAEVATNLNGCLPGPPARTDPSPQVAIRTANGCTVNTALVTIGDGGHVWPGGPPVADGPAPAGGFLATEAIWALFAANVAAGN